MRKRRAVVSFIVGVITLLLLAGAMPKMVQESLTGTSVKDATPSKEVAAPAGSAAEALQKLSVKGRAPKTGYTRDQFGDGWDTVSGCTTRNIILHRDLANAVVDDSCKVISGTLADPYSGETIQFTAAKASAIQIDHVVALSDAWQTGAQLLTAKQREQLANDPLELLAVSGQQNQAKSDGDAATWLPKNKAFRCEYVARQIAVKIKYSLWVTSAEKDAIAGILDACPNEPLPAA